MTALIRIKMFGGPDGDFWHEGHGTLMPDRVELPRVGKERKLNGVIECTRNTSSMKGATK